MATKKQIIFSGIFGFITLGISILLISANSIVKKKLEYTLAHDLPETITGTYSDISISTSTGSLSINDVSYELKNESNGIVHTKLRAKEIRIGNINYHKLLFSDELEIGKVLVDELYVEHYKHKVEKTNQETPELDIAIMIKKVEFRDTAFDIYEDDEKTILASADQIDLRINKFEVSPEILKQKIPVNYRSIFTEGRHFYVKIDSTETISWDRFAMNNQELRFHTIRYNSLQSGDKNQYMDLNIDAITLSEFDFNAFQDTDHLLKANSIVIESPKFKQYARKLKSVSTQEDENSTISSSFPYEIALDSIIINNAQAQLVHLLEDDSEELQLKTESLSIKITGFLTNNTILNQKIPFEHNTFDIDGKALFLKAGAYENLTIRDYHLDETHFSAIDIAFKTSYSRAELSRIIPVERDHYDLEIPSLSIAHYDFGFLESDRFYTTVKNIEIDRPILDIYRDKLVNDDTSFKPLYSRKLRELPFDLLIDTIAIDNAYVKYTERTKPDNQGGYVSFKDLNAKISTLGNSYAEQTETAIRVDALFMDHAPLKVAWTFNVHNPADAFLFRAELTNFKAHEINRFTEPNLNVKIQGNLPKTYFTIDGNNDFSRTDMRIRYSGLKVDILRKDRKESRKFLSSIANLLLKTRQIRSDAHFREGTGEAQRNKTQSVFNQLWISAESGLKKTIL